MSERSTATVGSCRARAGFTLIELIVSLAITGMVLAIALPRFDLARIRVDGEVQSARSALMMAQRLAVTRGNDVVVTIDTAAKLLTVHDDTDNDGVRDTGERITGTKLEGEIAFGLGGAPVLVAGMTLPVNVIGRQASLPALTFHRDGSVSEAAVVYMTTIRAARSSRPTDARALQLGRASGRVQLFRYDGTAWGRVN